MHTSSESKSQDQTPLLPIQSPLSETPMLTSGEPQPGVQPSPVEQPEQAAPPPSSQPPAEKPPSSLNKRLLLAGFIFFISIGSFFLALLVKNSIFTTQREASTSISPPAGFNGGRIEPDADKVTYTSWINGTRSEQKFAPTYPFSRKLSTGTTIEVKKKQDIILGWGTDAQGKCYIATSVDPSGQGISLSTGKVLFNWSTSKDKDYVRVLDAQGNAWKGSGDLKITATAPDGRKAELYVYGAKCNGAIAPTPTKSPTPIPSKSPTPKPSTLPTLTKTPTPRPTSSVTPTKVPPVACTLNADIMLVIDRSSSMNSKESDGRTKLEWAKQSAKTLVDRIIATPNAPVKIGVSSFGSQGNDGTGTRSSSYNSTLHIAPTFNYTAVKIAIDNVAYIQSGTCIECGIRIAREQLTSSHANNRVVILLSDGKANHNWIGESADGASAIADANKGRSIGLEYYVLGYGTGTNIDETTLKAIAGPAANYKYRSNVQDWPSAYLQILDQICITPTPSPTRTPTPTKTPTPSPTKVPTPTVTKTPTSIPTKTPTPIPTKTPTPIPTKTPTPLPTKTPTPTATHTPTPSPTHTPTPSPSPTRVPTATSTPIPSVTLTPNPSQTITPTPTIPACIKPNPVSNIKVSCPSCQ